MTQEKELNNNNNKKKKKKNEEYQREYNWIKMISIPCKKKWKTGLDSG